MENPFSQKELIQIGIALVAGGAFGALLKIAWDLYQSRIQPVGYEVSTWELFGERLQNVPLSVQMAVSDGVETRHYKNLYLINIDIKNTGNAHIDEFRFGVTLGGDDVAVYVVPEKSDRHHEIEQVSTVTLGANTQEIDFTCRPFNRRDSYSVAVFVSVPSGVLHPQKIALSTSHPIKFVNTSAIDRVNKIMKFLQERIDG